MDSRGLRGEVVNHVLVVLSDALCIVQSLRIKDDSNSIWAVTDIEILGSNTAYHTQWPYFYYIVVLRKQRC